MPSTSSSLTVTLSVIVALSWWTLVESHHDIGADDALRVHYVLGCEHMFRTVDNKATDTYNAIAFWTLHEDANDTNKNYGDYAISIDELEKRTGIDFFCNLPDEVEKQVEAEVDMDFWKLSK